MLQTIKQAMHHHGIKAKSQKTLILTYCLKYSSLLCNSIFALQVAPKKILKDLMCARVGNRWEEKGTR